MADAPTTPRSLARYANEIAHLVRQARSALGRIEDGRGSLIELESALVVQTALPEGDAGADHRIYGDLRCAGRPKRLRDSRCPRSDSNQHHLAANRF